MAVVAAALLVVASWIFVAVMALAAALGGRPLARRQARLIAAGASFVAVVGAFMAVGLVASFMVGMSHFDTGIPPDEQALLVAVLVGLAIIGSIVGALAARRVWRGTAGPGG